MAAGLCSAPRAGSRARPRRRRRLAAGSSARARIAALDDRGPRRATARDEPRAAAGRARSAARPALPHPVAEREIADAVRRSSARLGESPLRQTLHLDTRLGARRQHAPVLRQDLDGRVARGPGAVHGPRRRRRSACSSPTSGASGPRRRKELLKRASRGLVDDSIIDKPKRGFFHSALGAWLKVTATASCARRSSTSRRWHAACTARTRCARSWRARGQEGKKADQRLFSLVLLERWQRMFVDGQAARPPSPRRCASPPSLMPNPPHPHPRPKPAAPPGPARLEPVRRAHARRLRRDRRVPAGPTRHREPYERLRGRGQSTATGPAQPMAASSPTDSSTRRRCGAGAGSPGAWRSSASFDLVHACSPPDFLLLAMLPLRRQGTRFIFDHHDLTPELFASRFGRPAGSCTGPRCSPSRWRSGCADVVLSVNDSYRQVALDPRAPRRRGRVRGPHRPRPDALHAGCARSGARRGKHLPAQPTSASWARRTASTTPFRALAALKRQRNDWHAVFMGDGEVLDEMRRSPPSSGSADDVEFTGWVEHDTDRAACSRPPTSASRPTRRTCSTTCPP